MSLRRSLQLVSDLPFSQPEPHDDGEANAAAVLAAMPGGQAQLRWATPSHATELSSDLVPPPSSPGVSAARPPLSARVTPVAGAHGLVLPPRRNRARPPAPGAGAMAPPRQVGPVAADVLPSRPPSASAAGTVAPASRSEATAAGPVMSSLPVGATVAGLETPHRRAEARPAGVVVPPPVPSAPPAGFVTPTRRAGAPSIGVVKPSHRAPSKGAAGKRALAASAAAQGRRTAVRPHLASKGKASSAAASPVSIAEAVQHHSRKTAAPMAPRRAAASAPAPRAPQSLTAFQEPASPALGAHRPSLFKAPVQARVTAAAPPPRALTFRVPERTALDLAGGKSLTPSSTRAPAKAPKPIRKPAKQRAKRGVRKAVDPASPDQPSQLIDAPAAPPTAASQTGWTPIAPPPPVRDVNEPSANTAVTVAAMTKVFAEGLRPVCVHLAGLRQKLDEVHTSVNRLSTSLHDQGVGNERTAQAVVQLQGAVKNVYDGVVSHVKQEPSRAPILRGSTAMLDDCDAQQELASINELELGNVRDLAKRVMIDEMLGSTASYQAMPNRARSLEILHEACKTIRGEDQAEAEAYLASQRVFLTAAGTPTDKRIRVREKLYRISSHVVEALQKVAMTAYFKSLGESVEPMTPETAEAWLRDNKYAHSDGADKAVNAALTAMFRRNGHHSLVVTPKEVGDGVYVDASTGHAGLITHWARGVFEKVAGVRKARRSGNDDGAYDGWRAEVRSVSGFLRWHEEVHCGLRLCDGTDEHRAMNVADDGTYVIDSEEELPAAAEDALPAGSAGSSGLPWDSSQDLMPGYVAGDDGAGGEAALEGEECIDVEEGDGGEGGADDEEIVEGREGDCWEKAAEGGEGGGDYRSVEGQECADGSEGAEVSEGVRGWELAGSGDAVGSGAGGDSEVATERAAAAAGVDNSARAGPVAVLAAAAGNVSIAVGAGAAAGAAAEPGTFTGASVEDPEGVAAAACLDAVAASVEAAAAADAEADAVGVVGEADAVGVVGGDALGASPLGLLPECAAYPRGFAEDYLEEEPI